MSSIKNLKKEINYTFGEVIDEAHFKQLLKPDIADDKVEAIVDEAVTAYENFYDKIHKGRKAENKHTYFKNLTAEINQKLDELIKKIEAL